SRPRRSASAAAARRAGRAGSRLLLLLPLPPPLPLPLPLPLPRPLPFPPVLPLPVGEGGGEGSLFGRRPLRIRRLRPSSPEASSRARATIELRDPTRQGEQVAVDLDQPGRPCLLAALEPGQPRLDPLERLDELGVQAVLLLEDRGHVPAGRDRVPGAARGR